MKKGMRGIFLAGAFLAAGSWGVFSADVAFAGVKELLNSRTRPTVSEMKRELDPWPKANPFGHEGQCGGVKETLPRIIAGLERAFPGGTYAPLGRDAVGMGDMIDAFYVSIGQEGRVSRLNASTSSFHSASHASLVRFLESAGLVLGPQNVEAPPFVIFDSTSYSTHSQSTKLVATGYKEHAARGGDLMAFVRKFNLLTFGSARAQTADPNANLEQYFLETAEGLSQSGMPNGILGINISGAKYSHGPEFHGPFGQFSEQPDGRYYGQISNFNHEQFRMQALSQIFEAITIASNPEFLEHVKHEARVLGYEFPLERKYAKLDPPKPDRSFSKKKFKEIRELVAQKLGALGEVGEQRKGRYSDNGAVLNRTFWEYLSKAETVLMPVPKIVLVLFALETASNAYKEKKIGNRDFRRLVGATLGFATIDEKFNRAFRTLLKKDSALLTVLVQEKEFFNDRARNTGHVNAVSAYETIEKAVLEGVKSLVPCKEALKDNPPTEGEGKNP